MNILKEADNIINNRSQEKERMYGPIDECNKRVAKIASILCNKELTGEDIYKVMIALKLGRECYHHKEDNLLDLCAYICALNNHYNNIKIKTDNLENKFGTEY